MRALIIAAILFVPMPAYALEIGARLPTRYGEVIVVTAATGHRIPRIDGKVQNDELDLASVDHRRPQSLLKHRLDPNRGANSSEQKIAHSGNQAFRSVGSV